MEFHDTVAGKQFFTSQLPRLITALEGISTALKAPQPVYRLEQEVSPDYLAELYYGLHDPVEPEVPQALHESNAAIIACQNRMRQQFTPEVWDAVEQYCALLGNRSAIEREQAFTSGFRYATKLFAAGLSAPKRNETSN